MRTIAVAMILTLALAACAPDEEPATDQTATVEPDEQATAESERIRKTEGDHQSAQARREQLRESMREHRQAARDSGPETPQRERMRERDRAPWWHDQAIITSLDLDSGQIEAIEQATADHHRAQAGTRQEMAELRRRMSRSLTEGEGEQAATISAEHERLQQQFQSADQLWRQTIADILDPAQFERLQNDHPEALSAPLARRTERSGLRTVNE